MSQFIYCYAECYYAECQYAECHFAECCYAECRGAEYRAKIVGFKEQKKCFAFKTANLARFLTKYKHGFRVKPHKGR